MQAHPRLGNQRDVTTARRSTDTARLASIVESSDDAIISKAWAAY